jgi:predicted choloylglycine hydrolase
MGEILDKTGGYPPRFPPEILEKSRAYAEQMKIYAPDLLEEFRGITDHLGIDYYIPITLETTPYRFQMSNCVVFAISGEHTQSGNPALGHNQEWMERESKNLRVCYTHPDGKLKSMGFTYHWPLVSRYGGLNEAGLAISMVSASFITHGPGIMLNIAVRWILDTCTTTEEAVEFLVKIPKVWGTTYIVIDKENTIAKVEAHHQKTIVTYSDSGQAWNSLLYDSPELRNLIEQDRVDTCGEIASSRKEFWNSWLSQYQGKIIDQQLTDFLGNHEENMCYHEKEGLEICWSYVLKPVENEALLCVGRPCKNVYIGIDGP